MNEIMNIFEEINIFMNNLKLPKKKKSKIKLMKTFTWCDIKIQQLYADLVGTA